MKKKGVSGTYGFMSLPDDGFFITPIFWNMKRDPSGTKNDISMDIFCEYGYQET